MLSGEGARIVAGKDWLRDLEAARITGRHGRRVAWLRGSSPLLSNSKKRKGKKEEGGDALPAAQSGEGRRERLRQTWAALIDGVTIRTRADLARHLGVSRARVTQVLGKGVVHAVHADPAPHAVVGGVGHRRVGHPDGKGGDRKGGDHGRGLA